MRLRRNNRFYSIMALCLCTVACSPSMFSNYGRITPDGEVTKQVEGYEVNPEMRYYISGPDLKPAALMGLLKVYRLDPSTTWREVDMTPVKMEEIIVNMRDRSVIRRPSLQGFEMLDSGGRPIGIWYSNIETRTFLRMNHDGTVWIDTPDRLHVSE
ncbi:MAG: hypothetical protein ACYDAA_14000 [Syntrophales bacterium]